MTRVCFYRAVGWIVLNTASPFFYFFSCNGSSRVVPDGMVDIFLHSLELFSRKNPVPSAISQFLSVVGDRQLPLDQTHKLIRLALSAFRVLTPSSSPSLPAFPFAPPLNFPIPQTCSTFPSDAFLLVFYSPRSQLFFRYPLFLFMSTPSLLFCDFWQSLLVPGQLHSRTVLSFDTGLYDGFF